MNFSTFSLFIYKFIKLRFFLFIIFRKKIIFEKILDPLITVIILSWNNPHLTFRLLDELNKQNLNNCNYVIIDNGSRLMTKVFLKRIFGAQKIHNRTNAGYPVGVNQGLKACSSPVYVLLNNDAVPEPGWNQVIEDMFHSKTSFGIVGAKIVGVNGLVLESGASFWADGICYPNARQLSFDSSRANRVGTFDFCSGAFMAINASVIEKIGYFDETFSPAYYEDTDYCLRASKAGIDVKINPDLQILHNEHASTPQGEVQSKIDRSWGKFVTKHKNYLSKHPLRINLDETKISPICFPNLRLFLISDYTNINELLASKTMIPLLNILETRKFFVTLINRTHINTSWKDFFTEVPRCNIEIIDGLNDTKLHETLKYRRSEMDILVVFGKLNLELMTKFKEVINSENIKYLLYLEEVEDPMQENVLSKEAVTYLNSQLCPHFYTNNAFLLRYVKNVSIYHSIYQIFDLN